MSTIIPGLFKINGVISTDKTVLQNLNDLCSASNCWLTYDIAAAKWSVIINRTGTSVASFNDSNIIGNIDVSGSGVNELYNAVSIEFPHKDLRDQKDYVDLEVPDEDLFPNEITNTLNIQMDCINDPVQAQYLASVELKQSRVDKIIEFRTDYSRIGLKAGDLIDVTTSMYGYTNKLFRIVKVTEDDEDGLSVSITALEYDADVYSTDGLERTERSKKSGILLKSFNPAIQQSQDDNWGEQLTRMLIPTVGTALLNMLFSKDGITGKILAKLDPKPGLTEQVLTSLATIKANTLTASTTKACEGQTVNVTVAVCASNCVTYTGIKVPYTITGVTAEDIGVPLTGEVTLNAAGSATLAIPILNDNASESDETMTVAIGGKTVTVTLVSTQSITYSITNSPTQIAEGETVTFTVNVTGVEDGTQLPYTITGSASISSPTSGNVTITGGTGTVDVVTTDVDAIVNRVVTFTVNPGEFICPGNGSNTRSALVTYTGTPPEPDVTGCTYINIPIAWCGTYSSTGVLKSVSPSAYMNVLSGTLSGSGNTVTVPTSVTVSGGNITIASTAVVDNTPGKGGRIANVITAFNAPSGKIITGTTVQLTGY